MRIFLLAILMYGCTSLSAAPSEFYVDLLRRGVAEVDAGRPANAPALLRIAAFGLVDSIEHYEIAQVYLAIASDRLGEADDARQAAQRVVAAEKVERRYGSLAIAAPIRAAFDVLARKTLSATEAASLSATSAASSATVPVIPPAQSPNTSSAATAGSAAKPVPPKPIPAPTERRPVPVNEPAPKPATQKPAVTQKPAATSPTTSVPTPNAGTPAVPPQKPVTTPSTSAPASTAGTATQKPALTPPKPATQPAKPAIDVNAQLTAADRALSSVNLVEARRVYREVLKVQTLGRAELIRAGEGLYRARDFAGALEAFRRLGALRRGEEPYRYYIAVVLYETGDYAAAKRELAAALPHIELTPDVLRYRARIEGAR